MCGIIGYIGSKPVVPVLIEGLRRMEYRGQYPIPRWKHGRQGPIPLRFALHHRLC